MNQTRRRAVALISGGLDSMLAAKLVLDQGVHVEGLNFFTGFCVEGHTHAIRSKDRDRPKRNNALWVAEQLGIRLHFVDVVEDYKSVVLNPKHGYGQHLNPCIDCKSFMVGRAMTWLEEQAFDFVITGEVIGQRPKSQRRATMPIIARESGAHDRLLRPLCAKLLEPTLPEREGWVDRARLLDLSGRSRKPQISMARRFGFQDFAQPAGGCCFLTNEHYTIKLQDLWQSRGEREYDLDDIMLLKVGRHLRPSANFKLIVARDEGEGRFLSGYRGRFVWLNPISHRGALTLVHGEELASGDLTFAARIAARYTQGRDQSSVSFELGGPGRETVGLEVAPLPTDEIQSSWYL